MILKKNKLAFEIAPEIKLQIPQNNLIIHPIHCFQITSYVEIQFKDKLVPRNIYGKWIQIKSLSNL